MTDEAIIKLLNARDEAGLRAVEEKYGKSARRIAAKILGSEEDAQEVFQDSLMRLWNVIPPEHPDDLNAYLCTILRNLAFNRRDTQLTQRRGGGQRPLLLDELREVTADSRSVEEEVSARLLSEAINRFLAGLKPEVRTVFMQRYGNMRPIAEIAAGFHLTESNVKVTLMRTRRKLRAYLKKEGYL